MSQPKRVGQERGNRVICIVGHGPSILAGCGSVIDSCTVIRVKRGYIGERKDWGHRTDYLCGRGARDTEGLPEVPFWHFAEYFPWSKRWVDYFESFGPRYPASLGDIVPKPSHGLCAAFAAMEYLKPQELAFIGCDRILRPDETTWKWNSGPTCFPHDWHAENRALHGLGIKIIDLVEHGKVHRNESLERDGAVGGLNLRGSPPAVPLPAGC